MIKILTVDDHYLFSAGLTAIIQMQPDLEVCGMAGSVEEAVEAAPRLQPDIILMDFNLPDGSGADATRKILLEYPAAKVVFLSMSEQEEDVIAAIRSGARGYLLKNTNPAELVDALRRVQAGESAISSSMTLILMKELAQQTDPEPAHDPRLDLLTPREKEIVAELALGKSNLEIASALVISENTVKYHIHSILNKLELADRKQIAKLAHVKK